MAGQPPPPAQDFEGRSDPQNCRLCDIFITNTFLHDMLRELGHNEAATVFTVISRAMLACDVRGLSEKARVALLADRSYLVSRILGDYLVAHGNIPVKVGGRARYAQCRWSWRKDVCYTS